LSFAPAAKTNFLHLLPIRFPFLFKDGKRSDVFIIPIFKDMTPETPLFLKSEFSMKLYDWVIEAENLAT